MPPIHCLRGIYEIHTMSRATVQHVETSAIYPVVASTAVSIDNVWILKDLAFLLRPSSLSI